MNNLINYLLESGAALALFYLFYRMMRLDQSAFSLSRAYLVGSVIFAMVLPLLDFSASFVSGVNLQPEVMLEPVAARVENTSSSGISWFSVATGLYWTGAIVALVLLCYKIGRIFYLKAQGNIHHYEQYRLIILEKDMEPFSLFREVFMSRHTLEDEPSARIILEHELVHIRKYHSLDNLLAGAALAIQWFNPFMYLLQKELKRVHEYEADRQAIEKTGNYQDYQALLFQQTFGVPYLSPVNNFNSSIKKRLLMLRKSNSSRNFSRAFVFIPLAVALIFAFACSEPNNSNPAGESNERVEKVVAEKPEASKKASGDVFLVVEDMPKFQGGNVADFRKYVQQKLTYPEEAKEQGLEGTTYVKFIVNTKGEVEDVEVIRGSHDILDQAAADVIKNSPEWVPGKHRGEKVKVQFTIPMVFKLSDGS